MGRRHFLPGVWAACGLAAAGLTLSVNGTLSSWTTALVTNDTNTAATATAVILKEHSGVFDCYSSGDPSNAFTCSTINTYGGTGTPLTPGTSQSVHITFTNVGAAAAASFALARGTCSQTPTAGSGSPAAANLCTNGELTVAISCSSGTTYSSGAAWPDLVYAAGAPGSIPATLSHAAGLAAGASATCRFTVALTSGAGVLDQAITVSQAMDWTLVK